MDRAHRPPILLAGTNNPHKLGEIRTLLSGLSVEVVGAEVLRESPAIEETGLTFEENARIKARAFARAALKLSPERRPRLVVSDDSGLTVDALEGAPGIHSARFAGEPRCDRRNNEKLLSELGNVPAGRRGAAFVCALACAGVPEPGEEPRIRLEVRGECRGSIAEKAAGRGGFGYDPLFFVPDAGRTYAELTEDEKNRLSHRGRAFARLAVLIRPLIDEQILLGSEKP